jgi:hypothetical protein
MSVLHFSAICVTIAVFALVGYIVWRLSNVAPKAIATVLLALATLIGSIPLLLDFYRI